MILGSTAMLTRFSGALSGVFGKDTAVQRICEFFTWLLKLQIKISCLLDSFFPVSSSFVSIRRNVQKNFKRIRFPWSTMQMYYHHHHHHHELEKTGQHGDFIAFLETTSRNKATLNELHEPRARNDHFLDPNLLYSHDQKLVSPLFNSKLLFFCRNVTQIIRL